MKSRKTMALVMLAGLVFGGTAGTLAAKQDPKHPELQAALEDLHKAREHLRKTKELKGHRELAAHLVDQAINETEHAMGE